MKNLSVFCKTIFIVFFGLSSATPGYAMPAASPSFTVNTTIDAPGPAGDTICETSPGNGICTLRAAIMAADHIPGGGATIHIPAGTYTIAIPPTGTDDETSGDFNLTNRMVLLGAGETATLLAGNGLDRVFSIAPGVIAAISGVGIGGGVASAFPAGQLGGGIFDQGILTLTNDLVVENKAELGGGIYVASASLQVANSQIDNNTITPITIELGGGGIYCQGNSSLYLYNSTINGNKISASAASGGGIFSGGCTLDMVASTISGNTSTKWGGGIEFIGTAGPLIVVNSTIGGNYAPGNGGGINVAAGTASLYSTTVANNRSGTLNSGAGIENAGTLSLSNTLLANNSEPLASFPFIYIDDCKGALISQGYNLISLPDSDCNIITSSGDRLDTAADLGLLSNNGGPTQTYALLPASPAIGAGNPAGCKDNGGVILTTDQRGDPRQVDRSGQLRCDIGAYQAQLTFFLPLILK